MSPEIANLLRWRELSELSLWLEAHKDELHFEVKDLSVEVVKEEAENAKNRADFYLRFCKD